MVKEIEEEEEGRSRKKQRVRGLEPAIAWSSRHAHPLFGVRFLNVQDASDQLPLHEG